MQGSDMDWERDATGLTGMGKDSRVARKGDSAFILFEEGWEMRLLLKVILAVVVIASLPQGGQAATYQIGPNPNYGTIEVNTTYPSQAVNREIFYNYAIITITNTGFMQNMNNLYNYGTVINNLDLVNNGTLINNYVGTLNNNRHVENYGTLSNSGTMNNTSGSEIFNDGTLNNNGTLNNYSNTILANMRGFMNNSGIVNNYGMVVGNLKNNSGGTIVNYSGAILSTQDGMLNNSGSLINNLGGRIQILSGDTLTNSATLTNSGTLSNGLDGKLINSLGATLTNSGTLNNSSNSTLDNFGLLTNSGTLENRGSINGTGTYTQTGGKTINNGTMSQTAIDIQGGSMSGTGTINGEVNLASGAAVHPGKLTINGTFSSSGTLLIDISGVSEGKFNALKINGEAIFNGGNIEFDFIDGYIPRKGDFWDFLCADSIIGGETLNFSIDSLPNGYAWEIESFTGGERLLITQGVVPSPLPGTALLIGTGLGLLALYRRRKQTTKS